MRIYDTSLLYDLFFQILLIVMIAFLILQILPDIIRGLRGEEDNSDEENDSNSADDSGEENNSDSADNSDGEHDSDDAGNSSEENDSNDADDSDEEMEKTDTSRIVINRKSVYHPVTLKAPVKFEGKLPNPQDSSRYYLFLQNKAHMNIRKALEWGKYTPRNCVEQGGILVGRVAIYRNEVYCLVQDILLAKTSGNAVFVEFTHDMWLSMQQELSEKNESLNKSEQMVIVGWFHTHPNQLPVFMSGTDMRTQNLNFSQEWQVSLVMNPHMDKRRAFFGKNATVGKIVVLPDNRFLWQE